MELRADTERAGGAAGSAARPHRKLWTLIGVGLALVGAAAGVRVWWGANAPARAAREAILERERLQAQRLQQAQDAARAAPRDPMAHDTLAKAWLAAGREREAFMAWQQGVDAAPGDILAWQNLANGYLSRSRLAAAEQTFREMARRWPKNTFVHQGLAAVYRQSGRYREALRSARKALDLAPDQPLNHYVLGAVIQELGSRAAFPAGETGLLEEGRRHLTIAARAFPEHPDILYRNGRICLLTRRGDEARKCLEQAVRLTPNRGVAWLALSEARLDTGDVDGAIAAARRAKAVDPVEPQAPLALGSALLLKSDPASLQEAAAAFAEASRLKPDSAQCRERLGTALMRLQRLPEARAAFEAAADLDPNSAYPVQQLAQIYQRLGQGGLAQTAAKQAGILAYNDRLLRQVQRTSAAHPENWRIHLSLAARYRDLGWLDQAEDEYLRTLALAPAAAGAREGLAAVRRDRARKPSR